MNFFIIESQLGEFCLHNDECSSTVRYSYCNYADNICMCGGGEKIYEHDGVKYCYLKSMGEQCDKNDDCLSKSIARTHAPYMLP